MNYQFLAERTVSHETYGQLKRYLFHVKPLWLPGVYILDSQPQVLRFPWRKIMSGIIQCEKVLFRYNGAAALDGFSLDVQRGEVMALLGPNGAGKTTSIRVFNGLLKPENGALSVLGFDPCSDGAAIRAKTGVLTETPALYERLTAWQNLAFFGALSGLTEAQVTTRGNQLLDVFNLRDRAYDRVGSFSKGMKQRLALARALLHEPELLFLDEPTSDLDPEAARQVQDFILEVSRDEKRTVVLCTHRLYEAEQLCSRVAVMKHGRVLAAGTLDDLRKQVFPDLRVEIRTAQALSQAQLAEVSRLAGVKETQMVEKGQMRFSVAEKAVIPPVVTALVQAGAAIVAVEPHHASLEEIYLRLQHADGEVQL
jgi:ABC-2 type transport system ATP-binding protein